MKKNDAEEDGEFEQDDNQNENDGQDTFDGFRNLAVEQMANLAQLAAEARRLGLIPELPRELLEKLDLGGTLLDLVRLQLKHATALSSIVGPQGRNLEKLNQLSALLARGKAGKPRMIYGEATGARIGFEVFVDNPTDRPQKVTVSLGNLHRLDREDDGDGVPFTDEPGTKPEPSSDELAWSMLPNVTTVAKREIRSFRIMIAKSELSRDYETTATVRLSPLGSYQRYQLRPPKAKQAP
jgi:hypothetical protein